MLEQSKYYPFQFHSKPSDSLFNWGLSIQAQLIYPGPSMVSLDVVPPQIWIRNPTTTWLDRCPYHQSLLLQQKELNQSGNSGRFAWTLPQWCKAACQTQLESLKAVHLILGHSAMQPKTLLPVVDSENSKQLRLCMVIPLSPKRKCVSSRLIQSNAPCMHRDTRPIHW